MRNYRIASVWGIPIRINVSLLVFLPILAWLIGSGEQIAVYTDIVNAFSPNELDVADLNAGSTPWVIGSSAAVGLFASVALHELGHAWAGMRYGLTVESITLWILGGLASFDRMPKEWNRELVIAIAGPITSVLTGVACYVGVLVAPSGTPVLTFVLGWLAVTNVFLAVFNMLPAFPMDGGRILRAFLARSRPYADATRIAARIGSLFAILFAVFGVLTFSPLLLLLAFFVYAAATGESRMVSLEAMLDGFTVADVFHRKRPTVEASTSVADLTERFFTDRTTDFAVVENGEVVGMVNLGSLKRISPADRETTTVGSVATRDLPTVDLHEGAFQALIDIDGSAGYALVANEEGDTVGVLSRADFSDLMEMTKLARLDRSPQ